MLRLLLACCPAAFRETYTRDIEELFEARRARLRGRPMRLLWLWLTTAGDLFLTAGAEWRGALAGHRAGVRLENSPGRLPMTDRLMLDVRDAGRHLAAAPGFTVAAVAILALGIGSSTAIFSAVDAFALRSRPFARPTELVNIYQDSDDGRPESNSYPTYVDVSQYTDLFSGVGAVMPEGNGTLLTDSGDADFVQIEFATSSYFSRTLPGSGASAPIRESSGGRSASAAQRSPSLASAPSGTTDSSPDSPATSGCRSRRSVRWAARSAAPR
jgi:hypothetical protein